MASLATPAPATLAILPSDILIHMLSHVNDPETLRSFLKCSHATRALAADPVLISKWLTHHRPKRAFRLAAGMHRQDVALQLIHASRTPGEVQSTSPHKLFILGQSAVCVSVSHAPGSLNNGLADVGKACHSVESCTCLKNNMPNPWFTYNCQHIIV